jgi:hypothetical protein
VVKKTCGSIEKSYYGYNSLEKITLLEALLNKSAILIPYTCHFIMSNSFQVVRLDGMSPSSAGAYTRRRVIPRDATGRVIPRERTEVLGQESGLWVMDTPWTRESLARGNVPFE